MVGTRTADERVTTSAHLILVDEEFTEWRRRLDKGRAPLIGSDAPSQSPG
jgi:hypothetical protein